MALVWHTEEHPLRAAAERLSTYLKTAKEEGEAVLFVVSGGSALGVLDEVVIPESLDLTVVLGDERFSTDPEVNSFSQLVATPFYEHLIERGAQVISTEVTEGEKLELAAARLEDALREWSDDHPKGQVIALLGMGADGHTVGIIPGTFDESKMREHFEGARQWVVGYQVKEGLNPYRERFTTTFAFLRERVDMAVVYAAGEAKCPALTRVHTHSTDHLKEPIQIVHTMKLVDIFTDCVW